MSSDLAYYQKCADRLTTIKRWPGDGLEEYQQEPEEHHEIPNPSHVQKTLTALLGHWPRDCRLEDLDLDIRLSYVALPFSIQIQAAHKLTNYTQAIDHLFDVCEEAAPKRLLKSVDAYGAVKYGRRSFQSWKSSVSQHALTDEMRVDDNGYLSSGPPEHHGINLIIAKLVEFGKDTDENLRLLFGSEMIVLGAWMGITDTMVLNADVPANSPAAIKRDSLFDAGRLKPLLTCAHCSASVEEVNHQKCGGCRREVYCSKECATVEWAVHRIDCFRAQGKPVSAKHLDAANAAIAARKQAEQAKGNRDTLTHMMAVLQSVESDLAQTSFATTPLVVDCDGVPRRKDLSYYYRETMLATLKRYNIGLSFENDVAIGIPPVGADGDRWMLFRNPTNGAFVLLTYTKLFEGRAEGPFRGIAIDDVFVVKTAVPVSAEHSEKLRKARKSCSGEVEWMSVPRPIGAHINSGCTLLASWLTEAQLRATVPTKDLFYHVGSTSSMKKQLGYLGP